MNWPKAIAIAAACASLSYCSVHGGKLFKCEPPFTPEQCIQLMGAFQK